MKDQLKELLKNQVESHEEEIPQGHFDRFSEKLNRSNRVFRIGNNLKWAASILLLIGLGYMIAISVNKPIDKNQLAEVEKKPKNVGEINAKEVTKDLDKYFAKKVNMKVSELKKIAVEDTTLIYESLQELEVLEEEYNELKNKLSEIGDNKLVIKAMAKNYRTRLKLLDLLILRLEYNIDNSESIKEKENDTVKPVI